ncbi:MAG: DegT/DnrJ/EryC1/StrS family aminotransferase [Candidatus Staskawiczbacteria bacterium]|nr:DegT/DnrJ/EryC1/StrS family aminotransferase [Candidatus Staskawiczbacteria bacterium]
MKKIIKIPLNEPRLTKRDIDFIKKSLAPDIFHSLAKGTIEKFERKVKDYIGRKYAITCTSGTTALHLALMALNVKEGDEVMCPSYVSVALLHAINYLKAEPKLTDCNFNVEKGDFSMSFSDTKKKISKNTKVIIVPHMFGYPAEIDKIINLKIPVIEDATLSLGGAFGGKKIGTFGEISLFSFHYSKMITTGEGGILLTDSRELFERMKFFADKEATVISQRLDENPDYHVQYNYQMNGLGALLGQSQINQIDEFVRKRKNIAQIYTKHLKELTEVPVFFKDNIFWRYIIGTKKDSQELIKEGLKYGIEFGRGVYPPLHKYLKISDELFPNTKKTISTVMAVPIYPSLNKDEINYVIKILKKIL